MNRVVAIIRVCLARNIAGDPAADRNKNGEGHQVVMTTRRLTISVSNEAAIAGNAGVENGRIQQLQYEGDAGVTTKARQYCLKVIDPTG